jgi:hypothetical protein
LINISLFPHPSASDNYHFSFLYDEFTFFLDNYHFSFLYDEFTFFLYIKHKGEVTVDLSFCVWEFPLA